MKRRTVAAMVLALGLLMSCSRPDAAGNKAAIDVSTPVNGDWAVVRLEAEPDSLNPVIHTASNASYAMYGANNSQIFEFLLGYDPDNKWTLTKPLLAEGMPVVSDDHLTYTFVLRDGVKWHDGQPVTPEDVLFTFKATACPLTDAAPSRSYMSDIADIQIEGRSMKFLMKKPNSFNVINIGNTVPVMPKHVFDPEGLLDKLSYKDMLGPKGKDANAKKFADAFNASPSNRAPIGTGPYKFEKWDTGRELVLVRNDNYWGTKPRLDKIVYRFITDYTAALTALKSGEIDAMPRMLPIQFAQQTSGSEFERQFTKTKYSIPSVFYIMWNNERPFFKDKRVRQAMTMLLDRQKIVDTIRFGIGSLAVGPITPGNADFNSDIKAWPYDPKRAAELLDEAGWKDHDGDGIRDKDGVKFKFEFLGPNGSTLFPQLSPILREELKKVGIEMTERVIEFNVMLESLKDHKYDASTLGTTSDLVVDPFQVWHSSSAVNRGSNYASFKNPESDKLLEEARQEFDLEKRKQIYWKWQEIIHEEQPYTYLYYGQEPAAYSNRFQGVQWIPPRPGYDLQSWWTPKPLQKYGKKPTP